MLQQRRAVSLARAAGVRRLRAAQTAGPAAERRLGPASRERDRSFLGRTFPEQTQTRPRSPRDRAGTKFALQAWRKEQRHEELPRLAVSDVALDRLDGHHGVHDLAGGRRLDRLARLASAPPLT